MNSGKVVRCAIYTRKSSEEGLEQAFNSLDAQRESCAAYILSQAVEGWVTLPEIYDDGGLSGGTLERPALKRLLAEVAAGQVDIIVVYKVDRLTRSLFDFAKLVETFDRAGTSFVSVTQSFNTTTSMGRLTLNMLLSFAQFEREVTAERIRDKIAASKARGMWMGGIPPLGYRPDGRTLAIVEEHAAIVRYIFERYRALGNVRMLEQELIQNGIYVPRRVAASGKELGGCPFSRGLLHVMLRRVTYDGQIQHCDKVFVGNHPAIVDRGLFREVQEMLLANTQGCRHRQRAAAPALLAGKLVDSANEPMVATHTVKANKKYRYYVSRSLHLGTSKEGSRIPAIELETAVASRLARACKNPLVLVGSIAAQLDDPDLMPLVDRADHLRSLFKQRNKATLAELITQVRLETAGIRITCRADIMAGLLGVKLSHDAPPLVDFSAAGVLTRAGMSKKLLAGDGGAAGAVANLPLIRLVTRARQWWAVLRSGQLNITQLSHQNGVQPAYMTRVLRLAFLSPAVVDAMLLGGLRTDVSATSIVSFGAIPAAWPEQERKMIAIGRSS